MNEDVCHRVMRTPLDPSATTPAGPEAASALDDVSVQTYGLPCECPGCACLAKVHMQTVNTSQFKQVVVSAVSCDACGYRTNDVEIGNKISVKVHIPACGLDVQPGIINWRFTTVKGLLRQARDNPRQHTFNANAVGGSDGSSGDGGAFGAGGDSIPSEQRVAWDRFFGQLNAALRAEFEYKICLEDPLANSHVQSLTQPDPQIREEEYERTTYEEEELGLADMKTVQDEHGNYVKEIVSS